MEIRSPFAAQNYAAAKPATEPKPGTSDMGAVMSAIREQVQGRADMGAVSQAVREQLSA